MAKWALPVLLIGIGAGIGLWIVTDPQARGMAAETWNRGTTLLAGAQSGTGGTSLLEPIARTLKDFGDSVARLLSPGTIRIEVPSIQLPH